MKNVIQVPNRTSDQWFLLLLFDFYIKEYFEGSNGGN